VTRVARAIPPTLNGVTMKLRIPIDVKIDAICANLQALEQLLSEAARRSAEASELIQQHECNGAIGAILGLDDVLDSAKSLYGAALALHRTTD
jgi:hypothetical protein